MSFGTGSGPPATDKQLGYLESLLRKAGHTSWAEARRALGLTAKQGRGKFTKFEASALIDQLTASDDGTDEPAPAASAARDGGDDDRASLAEVPTELLVAELRRRGWRVTEPPF